MNYACTAEAGHKGRCRHILSVARAAVTVRCPQHSSESSKPAIQPHRILVKMTINHERSDALRSVGVLYKARKHRAEDDRRNVETAESIGRGPFAFRGVPDSGTPVFGPNGINEFSLALAYGEIARAGYRVIAYHMEPSRKHDKDVFLIALEREGEEQRIPALAGELLMGCWGFGHIWSNPPGSDGIIVQTVNLSAPKTDQRARQQVRFADGLWLIEESELDRKVA